MGLLAAIKQLPECASDTIISILQRGVTAEDTGRGLFWEGPIGSCLVTPGVWAQPAGEVGAAFWAWEAAGSQSLRGLLVPRMRWEAVDGQMHLAWERGAGWKCHWNHRREEGERPERAGGL